jgi:serine/threonine protein kinase
MSEGAWGPPGGGVTRREAGVGGGTRRESSLGGVSGTRRDGVAGASVYTRVNLPPELAGEFLVVGELGAGGEGFVLLVEDASGGRFVVKLYNPNLEFDSVASSLLAEADPEHVVRTVRAGVIDHDGSRFEVLEWCEPGSLRDVSGSGVSVVDVVVELSTALEHIHGLRVPGDSDARLVHQDLKPDNVFVRSIEPRLDLVLGDFGLARMIAGTRHYTSRQQGSRESPWVFRRL